MIIVFTISDQSNLDKFCQMKKIYIYIYIYDNTSASFFLRFSSFSDNQSMWDSQKILDRGGLKCWLRTKNMTTVGQSQKASPVQRFRYRKVVSLLQNMSNQPVSLYFEHDCLSFPLIFLFKIYECQQVLWIMKSLKTEEISLLVPVSLLL